MVLTCPGCGHLILASRLKTGESVQCPICERAFLPASAQVEASQQAADAAVPGAGQRTGATPASEARERKAPEGRYVATTGGVTRSMASSEIAGGLEAKTAAAVKLKERKKTIAVTAGEGPGRGPAEGGDGQGTYVAHPSDNPGAAAIPVPTKPRGEKPPDALDANSSAPAGPEVPVNGQAFLRDFSALSEEETDPFDTALVALALSEVIDEPASPRAGEGRTGLGIEVGVVARIGLLWALRGVLVLCGIATLLPWVFAEEGAAVGPANPAPAGEAVDLFSLNPASAGVILVCLAACLGVTFAASRRPIFRTVLVLQTLLTFVTVLIPFALYSRPGGVAGGHVHAQMSMAWGAWGCLVLCGLASAGAMIYLFVPTKGRSACD